MNIKSCEVVETLDLTRTGQIWVRDSTLPSPFKVLYTTPYAGSNQGGFIAIPEIGSRVLVCKPEDDENWYYMCSVFAPNQANTMVNKENLLKDRDVLPDKDKIYKARARPTRLAIKSPLGHELSLDDSYNPRYSNKKIELKSSEGKIIQLNDSQEIDSIIIRNEHGDRIKITTKGTGVSEARSIEIECRGSIKFISRESEMDLTVIDGRNINILNQSTGSKRINSEDTNYGNINITSENKDINLNVKSDEGSVFITSEGENSHIVLESEGAIDMVAKKQINMVCPEGNININGVEIHLND